MKFTPIQETDLAFVNEVRNECAEYLHDPRTFTLDQTKEWFKTGPKWWIIWHEGERIGYFRTSNYHEAFNRNTMYIGADLHKDYRGKGLAYEAYQKFIPIVSDQYKLWVILLEVLATNTRAINLYGKLGFQKSCGHIVRIINKKKVVSILMSMRPCDIH